MIKINLTNPGSVAMGALGALAAWKTSNFATDPSHLVPVAITALTGVASPNVNSANPNVSADSHIQTPYVNNLEETK